MKEYQLDAISRLALLGSVTFVIARIAWDVANSHWLHLGTYALLLAGFVWLYSRIVGNPDDDDEPSQSQVNPD